MAALEEQVHSPFGAGVAVGDILSGPGWPLETSPSGPGWPLESSCRGQGGRPVEAGVGVTAGDFLSGPRSPCRGRGDRRGRPVEQGPGRSSAPRELSRTEQRKRPGRGRLLRKWAPDNPHPPNTHKHTHTKKHTHTHTHSAWGHNYKAEAPGPEAPPEAAGRRSLSPAGPIHTHWDLNISFRETSCSRDNTLPALLSSLHQGRQPGMPETQSRCDFKRNSLDLGLGPADDILGKRRACSPPSNSECPLETKKVRSESPNETSHTPLLEDSTAQMTPEEHYRRMMSALSEHSSFEEQQQQRLYQLASGIAVPSHSDLLRVRQEVAAAAVAHLPSSSPSASSQRRKQGVPQPRETHFSDREMSHPPPLLSPQNAPHIALGPHLRPPFLGVPSALCQTPGYGFLQPAQAEIFARQQEMLRKQNLARLEMSAEIIRHKELETLHRQRLLVGDGLSLPPGLPPDHPALRSVHDGPDGSALRDDASRRNAMLVLRHGSAPLLPLTPHGTPSPATPPRESGRRASRKGGAARVEGSGPSEVKASEAAPRDGGADEDMKDSESEPDGGEEKPEGLPAESGLPGGLPGGGGKEPGKTGEGGGEPVGNARGLGSGGSSAESPNRVLGTKNEGKYPPPVPLPPAQPLPFGFPYTMSPYFHTGAVGGLFLDGEDSPTLEDISKWTVEDVCSFVGSLAGCSEYTQVFREQAIDGETLPLLTEEHLLTNMGLKLGPALKVRAQVAKRVGRVLYLANFPMAFPLQPPGLRPPERDLMAPDLRPASPASVASPCGGGLGPLSRVSPKQNGNPPLLTGLGDSKQPPS
uniref:Sterile alpha motif domain containing 11 n=1 Tax=Ornithorhynchus anatinus TaxID=9258 RepID=F6TTM8_ORNAN